MTDLWAASDATAGSIAAGFRRAFARPPELTVRAPGRLDLIGAHVDYNEGPVLVIAISRQVTLAVARAPHESTTVVARDLGDKVSFRTADLEARESDDGATLPTWALYPAGVAWALGQAGLACPSLDVLISSDVPIGAGVSSSAALEVAFALAWQRAGRWSLDPMELAQLCRRAENEYVGVDCGLMDQFASVFGQRDSAMLLDCRTLAWERLSMPKSAAVVLADTGTRRRLSDGRLNERHGECMSALGKLKVVSPGITALRDVTVDDLEEVGGRAHGLSETERRRALHIAGECARVEQAAYALRRGDVESVGDLMNESHMSARDLYEVSGPELDAMWSAANTHDACLGGRSVGAGFAGCQVFLVRREGALSFVRETVRRYEVATGIEPILQRVGVADGAEAVVLDR